MAYEQTTEVSRGQRVANALTGAMGGAKAGAELVQGVEEFKLNKAHTEQQMTYLKQIADEQAKNFQFKQAELYDTANKQFGQYLVNNAMSSDPGAAAELSFDGANRWAQAMGKPLDPQKYKSDSGLLSKAFKPDLQAASSGLEALHNPVTSNDAAAAAYKAAKASIQKLRGGAPGYDSVWATWDKDLESAYNEKNKLLATSVETSGKADEKQSDLMKKDVRDSVDAMTSFKRASQGLFQKATWREAMGIDLNRMLSQVQSKDPNLKLEASKQLAEEMARGLDSLLTSGTSGSAEAAHRLVPESVPGDIENTKQKILAKPQQYLSPAFIKQFENSVNGQITQWNSVRQQSLNAQESKLKNLWGDDAVRMFRDSRYEMFPQDKTSSGSAASGMVSVQAPDGSTGSIPKEQLQEFLKTYPGAKAR